jgi:hypothetical protein
LLQPEARLFRQSVSAAIPRFDISRATHGALEPLSCFLDLWADDAGRYKLPSCTEGRPTAKSYSLAYADFEPNGTVVEHIAGALESKLDVRIELKRFGYSAFLNCLKDPNVDLIYSMIQPAYNQPSSLMSLFSRRGWVRADREDFKRAAQRLESSFEADERLEACRDASAILADEVPAVPVVRSVSKCLTSDRAMSLTFGSDGILRPPLPCSWKDAR